MTRVNLDKRAFMKDASFTETAFHNSDTSFLLLKLCGDGEIGLFSSPRSARLVRLLLKIKRPFPKFGAKKETFLFRSPLLSEELNGAQGFCSTLMPKF